MFDESLAERLCLSLMVMLRSITKLALDEGSDACSGCG